MFAGYLAFSGTEIINTARTAAYMRNFAGSYAPPSQGTCDTLGEAMGDGTYSSPMQDEVAWFSPYRPESQEFYGLVGLSLEGFEDSTLTTPVIESTGEGGTFGRPRHTTNTLRVKALAVAGSEKAMDFGLAWARDVLAGSPCADGSCAGDTVCFLAECPEPCDWSANPTVVVDETYTTMSTLDLLEAATAWSSDVTPTIITSVGAPALRWAVAGDTVTIERLLTDLIPGTTYRVQVGVYASGSAPVLATVAGAIGSVVIAPVPSTGVLAEPTEGGVGVFTFIASDETHRLVLASAGSIVLAGAHVVRTSASDVALSTQPNSHPDQAFAWADNWAAAAANHTSVVSGATWLFQTVTGTTAAAAGALGVERRITGLTPGIPYTLTAAVNAETVAGTALGATLSVVGTTDSVSGAASTISTTVKGGWLSLTFTPTLATHVVRVAQRDALTLNTTGVKVGVDYLRVEEAEPELTTPTMDDGLWRYYRNVAVRNGLTVLKTYPPGSAVLRQVEFVFTAGNAQPVGVEIPVASGLGPGTAVIPEIACLNGGPVRHNRALNSSFGVDGANTFTLTSGSTATVARVADATAGNGWVLRLTSSAAGASSKTLTYPAIPCTPGMTRAFAFDWNSNLAGLSITMTARSYRASDASLISTTTVLPTTVVREVGQWERASFLFTPPPGAYTVVYDLVVSATWTVGGYLGIDRVLDEVSTVVGPWFNGDAPGGTWDGAAGASASTQTRASTASIVDPDCPPPPDAPRPPVIIDECLVAADTWQRHAIDVPAQFTAISPKVVPVVALTTGDLDARGVRVRVYANPFSRPVTDIDPCSYCGEFLLSYLPSHSTLTVDASTHQVIVTGPTGTTSGLNLLYGSDGGPITWPEMDCGIPYTITVDLDAYTSPLVNLAVSVIPVF